MSFPNETQKDILTGLKSFIGFVGNPMKLRAFIEALRQITREADEKKARLLLPLFEKEYPEFYKFGEGLVDLPPEKAVEAIINRWPFCAAMTAYQDHLKVIAFFQQQIKIRRSQHANHPNTYLTD